MADIYTKLSKHFANKANLEEEKEVQNFKKSNQKEYERLKEFWTVKEVNLTSYDSKKAWQKVVQKAAGEKRVSLRSYWKVVAAAAAVLLMVYLGAIAFYTEKNPTISTIEIIAKQQAEKIILEDGSTIYLNKDARLIYPSVFDSDNRKVTLNGEAFFEIAKEKGRPFIIETNHSEVKVLGTSFNIHTEEEQTEVNVKTGKVEITAQANRESKVLIANESAMIETARFEVYPTKNPNYLAWKTGKFEFEKTALATVINDLNSYYNHKILLKNEEANCLFTASFNKRKIEEVIEIIRLSCDLETTLKNDYYELR